MSQPTEEGGRLGIKRRTVLATAGATAAGLAVIPGSASAHYAFYGCSQVCTHDDGVTRKAVIAREGNCRCEVITDTSDRNDPKANELPQNQDTICYEVTDDRDDIVGICIGGIFHENDNPCAREKADCSDINCDGC